MREYLQFNNTVVVADIQHLATELVSKVGDGLEMLMLQSQRLAEHEFAGVEVRDRAVLQAVVSDLAINLCGDLAVVSEQLLEILWAEDVDLCKQQLALHKRRLSVI